MSKCNYAIVFIILSCLLPLARGQHRCTVIDFENFNPCAYPFQLVLPYGECGSELDSIEDAATEPKVIFQHAELSKKYILMMVDPDAPSRFDPRMRCWRHWLVSDIPGSSLLNGDLELEGEILTNYQGPLPPEGSGLHRYQFLLFNQPVTFSTDIVSFGQNLSANSAINRGRGGFDVNRFVVQHGLCGLLVAAYEYKASRETIDAQ